MSRFENIPPEFEAVRDNNETIYWVDQPTFVPFMSTGIPFLIIGIIWFLISYPLMSNILFDASFSFVAFPLGLFYVLHQFPFYGSILNMIRLLLVYKNTYYAYSNKRLMVRTGFFGTDFKIIDYDKIQNLEINVNPLEKLFNVGTIRVFSGEVVVRNNRSQSVYTSFRAIKDPYQVFKELKTVSLDIKTDWNYPNDLRPQDNQGYNTRY